MENKLQRFQRFGVEQEVEKTDVGDAVVIVGARLAWVVGDDEFRERIAGVAKRKGFLLALLRIRNRVGGLDVNLLCAAIHHEIDLVLAELMNAGRIFVSLDDTDIHGVTAADEFVVDGVFHEMREFRLAEIDPGVAKAGVGGVVFDRVVEMMTPFDIESVRLSDKKSVGKMVEVSGDNVAIGIDSGNGLGGVGEFRRIGEPCDITHSDVHDFFQQQIVTKVIALDEVAEVNGGVKPLKVLFLCFDSRRKHALGKSTVEEILLNDLEGVGLTAAQRHEFGEREREDGDNLSASAKLGRHVGCKQFGVRAGDVNIDIRGVFELAQDGIERVPVVLNVVRMHTCGIEILRTNSAAELNFVDENVVPFSVVDEMRLNVFVKRIWGMQVSKIFALEINGDDVVGSDSFIFKVFCKYLEQEMTLSAAANSGKDFYKAIVLRCNELSEKFFTFNVHTGFLMCLFVMFSKKMYVLYHNLAEDAMPNVNSVYFFLGLLKKKYRTDGLEVHYSKAA